ncbi:unnamed protein product [Penicillium olsonii]|uniref:Uncharacterized protein n=1 Tax=Penicillium olsonii TaxID=99116 RepID=A0A9W4HKG1_PENOL|nr:unnamed protein product [Penicillium olsonii]CAG8044218.1 unnamed protein product [Penicillium olsonii]CAG8065806.1 unnamed protein product [Penicillium olsonii]
MPHSGLRNIRRDVVPAHRLPFLVPSSTPLANMPALAARAPEASQSTTNGDKPTSNMTTTVLPVVLGAGLPILCAIIVLIVLHRRHVKKLLREDAMDKHKSLDFGMDTVGPATRRKGGPQGGMPPMSEPNHTKGLSLDVSPYLMPPGLVGSRDSLHSMSIDDDKYRPATAGGSIRSFPRGHRDDASSFAGSRFGGEEPNSGLLKNAQRMSRSSPPLYSSPTESHARSPLSPRNDSLPDHGLTPPAPVAQQPGMAIGSPSAERSFSPQSLPRVDDTPLHFGLDEPHQAPHEERLNFPLPEPSHSPEHEGSGQLPRISLPASDVTTSDYGDRKSDHILPAAHAHVPEGHAHDKPELPEEPQNLEPVYDGRRNTKRMTLGVRPLPPEDPSDNPEQRANRIRSFYKEYFDDSKNEATYYEDFGPEFYEDGGPGGSGFVYDPVTGEYYDAGAPPVPAPYAEPYTRRAMTPPPRAPPRFQGAARHQATNSAGFGGMPSPRAFSSASGPRAFSSASNRMPGPGRKPMPPPSPLQVLPTPHMLTDDSLMTAMDFAPAHGFKERRDGRAETPTGGMRPYSPAVRAHTPLASAFDELAVMPSPHALRKSGTYTNLDFVPPPRFRNEGGGSDAGSIRSGRSGMSAAHQNNIRMGNYRVSRLPPSAVGTRDDMMVSLKPSWDMVNNK